MCLVGWKTGMKKDSGQRTSDESVCACACLWCTCACLWCVCVCVYVCVCACTRAVSAWVITFSSCKQSYHGSLFSGSIGFHLINVLFIYTTR